MPSTLSSEQERLIQESAKISREAWIAGTLSLPALVASLGADYMSGGELNNAETILNIWVAYLIVNAVYCGYRQYRLFRS